MANNELLMNANEVVAFLQKPSSEWTKDDIVRFIRENEIKMVNLMYPGGDGKLKTLNFVINNLDYLDTILTCGERVDGSSLFSFIQAGSSDLYVVPRYSSAFVDPFAEIPTLCLLASYFDKDGNPLESSPEYTLAKAAKAFREVTGMEFHAMGELEYYVITPDEEVFPAVDQRGYHESMPYAKTNDFRTLCMSYIAKAGGQIKYGHSEVGNFSQDGLVYEQNEIEFLPVPVEKAADELMIAKWIIRNLAYQMGMNVTFAPKITTGKAGSGMHIHMRLMKDGRSMMLDGGRLSDTARTAIAGLMELAAGITAFGNKNPTSYFRLVPHQEAPTNICWGDRNRSVLVRVPLGWAAGIDMCHKANPQQPTELPDTSLKQTFEVRSPDGSADVYQLLAGLCVACRHGFELSNALRIAEQTYVDVNIHDAANAGRLAALGQLPDSCAASADCLERQRAVFEKHGVFSPAMIDGIIAQLRAFDDATLRKDIEGHPAELKALVDRYFHCG
ncbi:glutamine synthetase [Prevotella sp. oral taxon 475]|uniref:glutamine synthetase family protein n=1 Tax=Prevotella sp. oral taxon 475 TaxID=712471 RepID=UPI001BADD595|nr:glutamine synthetase family protein [Prevotella sp. oral taxon 475]QUB46799.1 glutamine synthetase [Prevotella sp. oral taxon 475]